MRTRGYPRMPLIHRSQKCTFSTPSKLHVCTQITGSNWGCKHNYACSVINNSDRLTLCSSSRIGQIAGLLIQLNASLKKIHLELLLLWNCSANCVWSV